MSLISLLKQKNILLLSGGWSAERDISIKSGKAVARALEANEIIHTHIDLTSEDDKQEIYQMNLI